MIGLGELRHPGLDRRQVLGGEWALISEVVVEPVLDHGPNGDLRLGEELLYRLREQMRGGVSDDLEPRRVLVSDNGKVGIALDEEGSVDQLAVDTPRERCLA